MATNKSFLAVNKMEVRGIFHIPVSIGMSEEDTKKFFADVIDGTLNPEPVVPTKVFDDMYFIGSVWVGTIIVKTSEGLVMIDAMNRPEDFDDIIKPGMEALGLNPAEIKIVLLTHGHMDHYGVAKTVKERYNAKVGMSKIDHELMLKLIIPAIPVPQGADADPGIDFYLDKDEDFVFGGKTIKVLQTPGHTPGGLSFIVPVTIRNKAHKVGIWGGTMIPYNLAETESYIDSINKFIDICDKENVDASLQVHCWADYAYHKGYFNGYLNNLPDNIPHPMLLGKERFLLYANCIKAAAIGQKEMLQVEEKNKITT